jgi:hypothetical protein
MPSSSFLRLFVATAAAFCVVDFAEALPSFGTKIPNGDKVPCPPNLLEDDSNGCTISGYCFGLGHPNCGGFQSEDKIEGNPPTILLGPFGEDWRSNGFVWTKELCELDSDQDGYTNGEELGDPCCVWSVDSPRVMLDSVDGFLPSHPGMKDHTPPVALTFDKSSLCANIEYEDGTTEADVDPYDQYYNPDETRGSFEFRIQPYPIPIKTTTYVDFIFNIPEDLPDLFHVVLGEAIIEQPDHLHHFVVNGCSSRIDPSLEGTPVDRRRDCTEIMIGAWAPGTDLFGNDSLDTGVMLGRGLGIEAIQLNIHYTDGVYENPETLTHRMATDGIKIHYTTDFRPLTGFRKRVLYIPFGPKEMVIPPNEPRYFVSKTCNVDTSCKDIDGERLQAVGNLMGLSNLGGANDLSCESVKMFCFNDGQIGAAIQQLCPVTCGLCRDTIDGEKSPRNPDSYRVTAVSYHAHLLGTEMYTTLLREVDDDASLVEQDIIQKQAPAANSSPTRIMAKDMKSREVWFYDDQASIIMDHDISVSDPTDAASTSMIQGMEVKPGDKIHITCVYDSTDRSEPTQFGLSTYEEMCITQLFLTFETPQALLEKTEDEEGDADVATGVVDVYTDIKLRVFTCDVDYENQTTDIYQGFLTEEEDARNIWFEHPIEESDQCIFPVENYVIIDGVMTRKPRNCPESLVQDGEEAMEGGQKLCYGITSSDDVEFLEDTIAGYVCVGGINDQKDSNEEPLFITEKDCLEVGGGSEYVAYSCAEIENWIVDEAQTVPGLTDEVLEYSRTEWWQPKCCRHQSDDKDTVDDKPSVEDKSENVPSDNIGSTAARSLSTNGNVLAFLAVATIVSMI